MTSPAVASRHGRLPGGGWLGGPPAPGRQPALDGLRGVGASLVFLVHFNGTARPWITDPGTAAVFGALGRLGATGVDLLFVLSGLLIHASLMRRPEPWRAYLRRRVLRLYPTFLAVFVLYLLIEPIRPSGRIPHELWPAAAYIVGSALLLPGLVPITPLIQVAWSLSFEAAFYAADPALIGLLRLRRWPRAGRAAVIGLLAVVAASAPSPYSRIGMFAGGMLVAEAAPVVLQHGRAIGLAALAGVPLSAALLLTGAGALTFWATFATLSGLCAAALSDGPVARALATAPLRWLGTVSYSFYLIHAVALNAAAAALTRLHLHGDLAWVLLPPGFLVSLAAASVLFRLVEQPFMPRLRPGSLPGAGRPSGPHLSASPASS